MEYSALFDAVLPALTRLGLPVPLGGTSNHFRRETLIAVGGWDPFNVTEDADLGFRLARAGWRTAVLAATTWEEAPRSFHSWFRQRTRWLKGWMQAPTYHPRVYGHPLPLWPPGPSWAEARRAQATRPVNDSALADSRELGQIGGCHA